MGPWRSVDLQKDHIDKTGDSFVFPDDGRDYIIDNAAGRDRSKLIIAFLDQQKPDMHDIYILQDGYNENLKASPEWSYPSAYECNIPFRTGPYAASRRI